eukprot:scaffold1439_cov404-Prasinococcus_capsulatus_cf.AAC.44
MSLLPLRLPGAALQRTLTCLGTPDSGAVARINTELPRLRWAHSGLLAFSKGVGRCSTVNARPLSSESRVHCPGSFTLERIVTGGVTAVINAPAASEYAL